MIVIHRPCLWLPILYRRPCQQARRVVYHSLDYGQWSVPCYYYHVVHGIKSDANYMHVVSYLRYLDPMCDRFIGMCIPNKHIGRGCDDPPDRQLMTYRDLCVRVRIWRLDSCRSIHLLKKSIHFIYNYSNYLEQS